MHNMKMKNRDTHNEIVRVERPVSTYPLGEEGRGRGEGRFTKVTKYNLKMKTATRMHNNKIQILNK